MGRKFLVSVEVKGTGNEAWPLPQGQLFITAHVVICSIVGLQKYISSDCQDQILFNTDTIKIF